MHGIQPMDHTFQEIFGVIKHLNEMNLDSSWSCNEFDLEKW